MRKTYKYGHRTSKRRHAAGIVIAICALIVGPIVFVVYNDLKSNSSGSAEGTVQVVGQVVGESSAKKLEINEPLFTMKLPVDWKEISRDKQQSGGYIVTWQATKKNQDNRWLSLYVDAVPTTKAVNRLLPVMIQGGNLTTGDVSDNCSTFTGAGSGANSSDKSAQKETLAKWQGVDFICDLPNFVDNKVGVGAVGGGVNQLTITGPQGGAHKYFFLFIDRNIQPDYMIFTSALQSFQAK